jgi:hypothetical protein
MPFKSRAKEHTIPFRSIKQQKYMYARHPDIAKRWQREYGNPRPSKRKKVKRSKTSRHY